MALKNNTWKVNQWYDQAVAGNISYSGENELFVWGANGQGQLGLNDKNKRSSPVQVPGTTWNYLSASRSAGSFGTKTDGTLWAWGPNDSGTLGQNNRTDYSSPKRVGGASETWLRVSGYGEQTSSVLATKTNGTLWAWGRNYHGVLGLNENGNGNFYRSSPTQVGSDTTWGAIAASTFNLAIKTDGTLWGWGENGDGQLAQNDNENDSGYRRSSPVQVGSDTTWSSIGIGIHHCGAIKTDGTLWMWGAGSAGNLGQNSTPSQKAFSSPVQVPGTTWSTIDCARMYSVAVKTDGTLWSWGYNSEGQLGHNDKAHRSSPVQVPGTTWRRAAACKATTQATKTDGSLWSWGSRDEGALGLGEYTKVSSPIQVGSNTGWNLEKSHHVDGEYVMAKFIK